MAPMDHNRVAPDGDGRPDDWERRHARLEGKKAQETVREEPAADDDWKARHSRTKSDA